MVLTRGSFLALESPLCHQMVGHSISLSYRQPSVRASGCSIFWSFIIVRKQMNRTDLRLVLSISAGGRKEVVWEDSSSLSWLESIQESLKYWITIEYNYPNSSLQLTAAKSAFLGLRAYVSNIQWTRHEDTYDIVTASSLMKSGDPGAGRLAFLYEWLCW